MQVKEQHEVPVSYLLTIELSKCHSEWYAGPYVHLSWFQPTPSIDIVFNATFHKWIWGYFPLYQNTAGVTFQTKWGLISKQHLTLITLPPISMLSNLLSSCRSMSWVQRNTHHWSICTDITFAYSGKFGLIPLILLPKATNCLCNWVALTNLLSRADKRTYRSSVTLAIRELPFPCRYLASPTSWN